MTVRLISRPLRRPQPAESELEPSALDDEAELRDNVTGAIGWLQSHVVDAAATGALGTLLSRLPWDAWHVRLAGVATPMANTAARAADAAVAALGAPAWDSTFPLARRAASEQAAQLVTQISDETRQRLADIVTRGLGEGWDVPRTAREIRQQIGLTDAWAQAVTRQYDANVAGGMNLDQAAKLADQYHARLLDTRATTIARTELLGASNQGRLAGWTQAASAGIFDPATATKRWIVGDSPCPECDVLDGEETAWDGAFSSGDDMPPAHPNCRCTAIIENVEQSGGGEPPAETLGPSEEDVADEPVAAMLKYSDDQPRDEHGRFGSGGGSSENFASRLSLAEGRSPSLEVTPTRVIGEKPAGEWQMVDGEPKFVETGEMKPVYAQPSGQLRSEEKLRMDGYTDDAGCYMYNEPLRDGSVSIGPPSREPLEDLPNTNNYVHDGYRVLDSSIARSRLSDDTVLYRGIALSEGQSFAPGQSFIDHGYVSTTSELQTAHDFASMRAGGEQSHLTQGTRGTGDRPVVMRILVPKGTPAIRGDTSVGEVVLPRETSFTVHSIGDDGVINIEAVPA